MTMHPPVLATGVEALGLYQGSGYVHESYLVRRPDGQVVQLSSLLYQLLESVDGKSSSSEIASRVSASFGRTVSAENVDYLLESKFAPLGLLAEHEPVCADANDAILTLRFRVVLIKERQVQFLGRLLRPLFLPVVIAAFAVALVVFDGWMLTSAPLTKGLIEVAANPSIILLVLALAVASALFHECGHAAACCYGGAKPGVIGMGIYVVWPAFYTNVTDSYRLSRGGRIRTDLGGVYFNAVFALLLGGVYLATGFAPLLWAIVVVHIELIEQLIPTFRFDGYFILGDLAGVPDLFAVMVPVLRSLRPGRPADPRVLALKRSSRIAITSWVLVAVPVIVAEIAFLIYVSPQMIKSVVTSFRSHGHELITQFARADIGSGLLSLLSVMLLLLPLVGLVFVLQLTVRRLGKAIGGALKRRGHSWAYLAAPLAATAAVVVGFVTLFATLGVNAAHRTSSGSTAEAQAPTTVSPPQPSTPKAHQASPTSPGVPPSLSTSSSSSVPSVGTVSSISNLFTDAPPAASASSAPAAKDDPSHSPQPSASRSPDRAVTPVPATSAEPNPIGSGAVAEPAPATEPAAPAGTVTPAMPTTPAGSAAEGTAAALGTPAADETPAVPATPSAPPTPAASVAPAAPVTPAASVAPAAPVTPAVPITPTASASAVPVPSAGPTPGTTSAPASPSPSGSASAAPSPSAVASGTPSVTPSASAGPSPSESASGTPSPSASAPAVSPSASGAPSSTDNSSSAFARIRLVLLRLVR